MTDSRSRSDPLDELEPAARLRVRVGGLLGALFLALILAFAGPSFRQSLFDLYQRITPVEPASDRVHVVVIDARSLAEIGGWPWSRFEMANLTEAIAKRGAAAIGFDLLFVEPDRLTLSHIAEYYPELPASIPPVLESLQSPDARFANMLGRSPVVVARVGLNRDSGDLVAGGEPPLPPDARFTGPPPAGLPDFHHVIANLPILEGSALGRGLVNGPPDPDGVIRRVPLVAKVQGALTPSFALELVRVAENLDAVGLEGGASGLRAIKVGEHRVPADSRGRLTLRFRDVPLAHTTSAADLSTGKVAADAFRDKIVLVGLTSAGTSDVVTTPRVPETFGVFVQAQAVDAILRGAGLRRPAWIPVAEWLIGLAHVAAAWVFVPRTQLSWIVRVAVVSVVVAVAGSWLAFAQGGLLVDPLPVLAPGAATTIVMISLLFVEGRRMQGRLAFALETERLGAARIAGELAAASEIQAGMLLPRAALASVEPAVEVDAVLQPARTVGGDLYDAFVREDRRLCFLVGDVTGKGVPASLFMALSKALSRSMLMRPGIGLGRAVAEINAELSRDNGQAMALSLLVGVLDPADGRVELVCAGHENPLLVSPDGATREIALEGGPPLCVDETYPYPVEVHALRPGETLVVLTDGVTEAHDPQDNLFGRDRAVAALGACASRPLPELIDRLVASVRAFEAGREPTDDLTVLALRLKA